MGARISRGGEEEEEEKEGGGSGTPQKVGDPALNMLTPALNFQSLNTLSLTL